MFIITIINCETLPILQGINILNSVAVSKELGEFGYVALLSFSFTTIKNFYLSRFIAESNIFMPQSLTRQNYQSLAGIKNLYITRFQQLLFLLSNPYFLPAPEDAYLRYFLIRPKRDK